MAENNSGNMKGSTPAINENTIYEIVAGALKAPGVKIDRTVFLTEQFKDFPRDVLNRIIAEGPIAVGISKPELRKKAESILIDGTLKSTAASFAAGLPGGFAMAISIPADMMQFYAFTLRIAQQISYIYGEPDLWSDRILDEEKVRNQLLLYLGVMLGATGATQTIRVLSSALAKHAFKKLPQKALTKTFYYPIVKSIAKLLGKSMTKTVFAKGVSKAIPIIGGIVSGGITYASMRPMGQRLIAAFEEVHFDYNEEKMREDLNSLEAEFRKETDDVKEELDVLDQVEDNITSDPQDTPIENLKTNQEDNRSPIINEKTQEKSNDSLDRILQAKKLLEAGIINEEEFTEIKKRIISEL